MKEIRIESDGTAKGTNITVDGVSLSDSVFSISWDVTAGERAVVKLECLPGALDVLGDLTEVKVIDERS